MRSAIVPVVQGNRNNVRVSEFSSHLSTDDVNDTNYFLRALSAPLTGRLGT